MQVVLAFAGVATTTPAGKLSVKSRLVAASALPVLSMVKVKVETIVSDAKTLLKVGIGSTFRKAFAVPELPKLEVKLPVRFICVPVVEAVTVTVMVQVLLAATLPPE